MRIYHLDCTLRDGGYYNNWNFSKSFVQNYINQISKINIDCVELGFRFLKKDLSLGNCAYTTDKFLNSLNTKNLKIPISVMLNASEFIDLNIKKLKKICDNLFLEKNKSKVSIVRIACRLNELEKINNLTKILKKKGYKIIINLMQVSLLKDSQLKNACRLINKLNIKVFYIADSIGSLQPKDLSILVKNIKKKFKGHVGVHMHDNMKLALSNTLAAKKSGAVWLDSTISGMGRGAGNTCTDDLIHFISRTRKEFNIINFEDYIKNNFLTLKSKYDWGSNIYYKLSALYNIHPTYVQELLKDKRYNKNEKINIIEYLREHSAETYSKNLLSFPRNIKNKYDYKGEINTKKITNKTNFLVFGAGETVKKYKKKILNYINKNKPYVISVNFNKFIADKHIDNYSALNFQRFVLDFKYYLDTNRKIILPKSLMEKHLGKNNISKLKVIDFGTKIKKNDMKVFDNYSEIPNFLTATYVFSFILACKPKKITLAGFDGYENDDILNKEMNKLFILIRKLFKGVKINSITPTNYKVI